MAAKTSTMRQGLRLDLTTVLLLVIIAVLAAYSWVMAAHDSKKSLAMTMPIGSAPESYKDLREMLQRLQEAMNQQAQRIENITKLEQRMDRQGALLQNLVQGKKPGSAMAAGKCAQSQSLSAAQSALLKYSNQSVIPKIIHQMYGLYGDGPPSSMPQSMDSFKRQNPDYTHILWKADDVYCFVEQYYPAIYPVFMRLKLPVLKADIARYLVVLSFGGVYSDVDTICLKPVDQWADGKQGIQIIVGVEADGSLAPNWERSWGRKLQICQWTFAASPHHPVLTTTIYRIMKLLIAAGPENITNPAVTHTTGPSVFSDSVYDYMATQGHKWEEYLGKNTAQVIGDMYLLTITGFSPGVGHMGAKGYTAPEAKVRHMFKGSWTKQGLRQLLMRLP